MQLHPLRRWRAERGLTQEAFIARARERDPEIRIAQPYLSMIEQGRATPSRRLARALSKATGGQVTMAKLLRRSRNGRG